MRRALIRTLIAASLFLAAASVGYFLSSSLGQDVVRAETERQLGDLLRGKVEIDRLRVHVHLGLRLRGENIRVYPGSVGSDLEARLVDAEIDVLSLLLGEFRLRWLRVEDLRMRIERNAEGDWSPRPLAILQEEADARPQDDPERHLAVLRAFESVTRVLLEDALVAGFVELHNGTVEYIDWRPRGPRAPPLVMRLEGAYGTWDHRWWSAEPELALRGEVIDERKRRTRIEAEGRQLEDGRLRLALAATGLDLEPVETYLEAAIPGCSLSGRLSGVLAYETLAPGNGLVEIDWVSQPLGIAAPRRGAQARIDSSRSQVRARLEVHPGRLRLASAEFRGDRLEMDLNGVLERPLRESARAHLAAEIRGADLEAVRRVIEGLPDVDRRALSGLLERVESGRVVRVGGRGATRLSRWRSLFLGELTTLPVGMVIGADVEDLTVGTGERDRLTDLSGRLEWSGDRIEAREIRGNWNDGPLPVLDLSLDGLSHLFEAPDGARTLRGDAAPLRGLGPLADVLRDLGGADPEASDLASAFPPIELELDEVHHAALRWPLLDARITVRTLDTGVDVAISQARWAGAPIQGEAVFSRDPEPRVTAHLTAESPPAPAAEPMEEAEPSEPRPPDEWMWGRFRVGRLADVPLSFEELSGEFRVRGARVQMTDMSAPLIPRGRLEGHATIDLDRPKAVPVDVSLQLRHGDLSSLAGVLGFPPDFATGSVNVAGTLDGKIRPGQSLLTELSGVVSVSATEGEIRKRVPVVIAMAQATEGFNPFAAREAIRFESIESIFHFDRGRIEADEFTLEGPMRVFASGRLDLRDERQDVKAVVGVFLFRQADQTLGKVPLVGYLVSDKGMVGAYFEIEGSLDDPDVRSLPAKTLTEQVPDFVKAPFRVLRFLLGGGSSSRDDEDGGPARRAPGPGSQGSR